MVPTKQNTDHGALLTLTAQGAGTLLSEVQENLEGRGVIVVIDITAVGGTPNLTVTLQAHDTASGKNITLLASAALASVATTTLTFYPGAAVTANVSGNGPLPLQWSVKAVVAGGTPSVTATISALTIR